jgi:hypothetical protein
MEHSCSIIIIPDTIEVRPYARTGLCCPCLHHFRAAPTSLHPSPGLAGSIPLAPGLPHLEAMRRCRDLRSNTRTLSPHATGLTPGPAQVLMPFASLRTLAFSTVVEDRRVSCLNDRFVPHPDYPSYFRPD